MSDAQQSGEGAQGHSGEGGDSPSKLKDPAAENKQEALIDEAVDETFPASDPISPKRIT